MTDVRLCFDVGGPISNSGFYREESMAGPRQNQNPE